MQPSAFRRLLPLAVLLLIAGCVKPLTGTALTDAAIVDLKAGRNTQALAEIQQRLRENPRDAQAAYLRGVAFNQLGRYDRAALSFAAFRRAGGRTPSLDLTEGTALLNAGKAEVALPLLEAYRAANPASAAAMLASGRAQLVIASRNRARPDAAGLRRAETLVRSALGPPATHNAAELLLALTATARKDRPAARRALDTLLAEAPNSPQVDLLQAAARKANKG